MAQGFLLDRRGQVIDSESFDSGGAGYGIAAAMAALSVAAFTQGQAVPSARFRVRQYVKRLRAHGVLVSESPARLGSYPPAAWLSRLWWLPLTLAERLAATVHSRQADVALFQREMVSTLYSAERFCKVPAVLDVDDAIWLHQRWRGVDRLAERCQLVVCGNAFIADHFCRLAPVRVIPTAVDADRWTPGEPSERPVIVWSGSSAGLPYLLDIESALRRVLSAVPRATLRVVSDRRPRFQVLAPEQVDFVPWAEDTEVPAVQSASVGLMPMADTPWSRGKCSFKLLTYLACGVPGVASPYGMNKEVIGGGGALGAKTLAEWTETLVMLLRDPSTARSLGAAGRASVERSYSTNHLAPKLAAALRDATA